MLKIANGTVYDPRNGMSGKVRDVWIDGGRVVAAPAKSNSGPIARSTHVAWLSCPAASTSIATLPVPR